MGVIYGLTHNCGVARRMAQKRKGRPPGKRKVREPLIAARVPDHVIKFVDALREERGLSVSAKTRSAVVRQALEFWVYRNAISRFHNTRLGIAIAVLADRVEEITDKSWIDDALTRQVVRKLVLELASHILRPLSKPVAVPADIKEEAGLRLALLKHVTGSRTFAGTVIIDDPGLAMISQSLNRSLGDGRANVETRPALVARRKQKQREKK
jgi:Arc/MetJ-type ribon-helix-helix transcriptional regulator